MRVFGQCFYKLCSQLISSIAVLKNHHGKLNLKTLVFHIIFFFLKIYPQE